MVKHKNTTTGDNVVVSSNDTTINDDVVIKINNTTDENIEVVVAEIVEACEIDYSTMITFDIKQDYSRSIKSSFKFDSMAKTFGGHSKGSFEIEKEELQKIYDKADTIADRISEIITEYKEIQVINDTFTSLKSDIRVIQDIYISCYSKVPTSEIWLVGCGYIERIYELEYLIMPYGGIGLFEEWESIKYEENLDDSKVYMNREKYFEEIELYRSSRLEINKDDITGSLVQLMLSSSHEIDNTFADYIDIRINNQSISLSIEHFIDWINDKPIKNYKVDIDNLKRYQEQLYKYKNVRSKTMN